MVKPVVGCSFKDNKIGSFQGHKLSKSETSYLIHHAVKGVCALPKHLDNE
jgi:hypothetical protein